MRFDFTVILTYFLCLIVEVSATDDSSLEKSDLEARDGILSTGNILTDLLNLIIGLVQSLLGGGLGGGLPIIGSLTGGGIPLIGGLLGRDGSVMGSEVEQPPTRAAVEKPVMPSDPFEAASKRGIYTRDQARRHAAAVTRRLKSQQ